jgi:hypothetical protein
MAFLGKPKSEEQYGRLMGMITPEATPSKRIGTEAPTGSVAAGPAAGKSAAEFTQTTKASPGSVFSRQLGGANIEGITSLAEKPLGREAGQEAMRVAGEGLQYKQTQQENLAKQPQFQFAGKVQEGGKEVDKDFTSDIIGKVAAGGEDFGTAQNILSRTSVPVGKLDIGDVKEFTPLQALRGGSVESLIRKEATGPYTTGMAGLDALLFQKKGGAQQLGQRGMALRAAEQATADALEKSATAEAEDAARRFVSGQKEQLQAGIKGGLTAREEAYTKAPEGQKSRLQQAQEKLQSDYQKTVSQELAKAKQIGGQQRGAIEGAMLSQALSRMFPGSKERGDSAFYDMATLADPAIRAQIELDPEYQRQKAIAENDIFARMPQDYSSFVQQSNVPTAAFQNVITPEDAAQYNRLQSLIGGQQVTPETLATPAAKLKEAELRKQFQELLTRSGLFPQSATAQSSPLGSSFGGINV